MTEKSGELSANGIQKAIAWKQHPGSSPGVMFLGGFRSDMNGTKAAFLADRMAAQGVAFTRFDYQGHGATGGDYRDYTVGDWVNDALAILDNLTKGPQILVGSSLGGWIMLRVAQLRPERVAGMVTVAPAPDFLTELVLPVLSPQQRQRYEADGGIEAEGDTFTRHMIDESRQQLVLDKTLPFSGPVRILQGMQDASVPWQHALRVVKAIGSEDVRLTLFKGGDHRLSRPEQLEALVRAVDDVITIVKATTDPSIVRES